MRKLCLALAILVLVFCVAAGFILGDKVGGWFCRTFVSYNPTVITIGCTAVGAIIGLLSACGFVISAVLAGRVAKLEKRVRRLNRGGRE